MLLLLYLCYNVVVVVVVVVIRYNANSTRLRHNANSMWSVPGGCLAASSWVPRALHDSTELLLHPFGALFPPSRDRDGASSAYDHIVQWSCTPIDDADSSVAECKVWCSSSEGDLRQQCARCDCQACPECATRQRTRPSYHNDSWGIPCSNVLLILLRGMAFRSGRRGSLQGTADEAPQIRVLESIRDRVVQPAMRLGWKPEVVASLSVGNSSHASHLYDLLRSKLCASAMRLENGRTQMENLHAALHWSWFAGWSRFGMWGALLILRADVEIKMDLPLPSPKSELRHEIHVPFEALVSHVVSKRASSRGVNTTHFALPEVPDVCDVIIYLPRCRLEEFVLASVPFMAAPTVLHKMCHWSLGAISYFIPGTYNSDTAVHTNPLYRMISRSEGPTKAQWAACQPEWGWTPQWCGRSASEQGRRCPLRPGVSVGRQKDKDPPASMADRHNTGRIESLRTVDRLRACIPTGPAQSAAPWYRPYIPLQTRKYDQEQRLSVEHCTIPQPAPIKSLLAPKGQPERLTCSASEGNVGRPLAIPWAIVPWKTAMPYTLAERLNLWNRDLKRVSQMAQTRKRASTVSDASSSEAVLRQRLFMLRGDGQKVCRLPCGSREVGGRKVPFQSDAHD